MAKKFLPGSKSIITDSDDNLMTPQQTNSYDCGIEAICNFIQIVRFLQGSQQLGEITFQRNDTSYVLSSKFPAHNRLNLNDQDYQKPFKKDYTVKFQHILIVFSK